MGAESVQSVPPRVVGERRHRVTLPLPGGLPELRAHASRCFRREGERPTLWHSGVLPLKEQAEYFLIRDGDVVVAQWDEGQGVLEPLTSRTIIPVSTAKADYVWHNTAGNARLDVEPRARPSAFVGETVYKGDYIGRSGRPQESSKPMPSAPFSSRRAVPARTAYTDQYSWPKTGFGTGAALPERPSTSSKHRVEHSMPFKGESVQMSDYAKADSSSKMISVMPVPAPVTLKTSDERMDLTTTYGADFRKMKVLPKSVRNFCPAKPSHVEPKSLPLQCCTEYRRQYAGREPEGTPIIHLEPATGSLTAR
mmetsp:Transcript_58981/g.127611  ORF Transcript_58981/g.127611 Transcript_58981/m.127611 type:complete len:309 (-) Transcript_58981:128-1054(-)